MEAVTAVCVKLPEKLFFFLYKSLITYSSFVTSRSLTDLYTLKKNVARMGELCMYNDRKIPAMART